MSPEDTPKFEIIISTLSFFLFFIPLSNFLSLTISFLLTPYPRSYYIHTGMLRGPPINQAGL